MSGGVFNPCLAFAQICWQNLTFYYSKDEVDGAYWTPEYAVSYILGPMIGAYLGANCFNFMKIMLKRLKNNNTDIEENDEERSEALVNQFAFSLTQQIDQIKSATSREQLSMQTGGMNSSLGRKPPRKHKQRSRSAK